LPTKAGRGWVFFPSLAEGKNHPLPIRGDCFIWQLGLFVREIRFHITIMNHCPGLTTASGQIGAIFARAWFA